MVHLDLEIEMYDVGVGIVVDEYMVWYYHNPLFSLLYVLVVVVVYLLMEVMVVIDDFETWSDETRLWISERHWLVTGYSETPPFNMTETWQQVLKH